MPYELLYNDIELAACDAAEDQGIDKDEIWADIAFNVCFMQWDSGPATKADIEDLWEAHFGGSFASRLRREGIRP